MTYRVPAFVIKIRFPKLRCDFFRSVKQFELPFPIACASIQTQNWWLVRWFWPIWKFKTWLGNVNQLLGSWLGIKIQWILRGYHFWEIKVRLKLQPCLDIWQLLTWLAVRAQVGSFWKESWSTKGCRHTAFKRMTNLRQGRALPVKYLRAASFDL